jgi:hypothetical protein
VSESRRLSEVSRRSASGMAHSDVGALGW